MGSSANRLRKHHKTFTGCWTCRARKVKCDEDRPSCGQCKHKNITCGGYAVRLHWLAPGSGLEEEPEQLNEGKYQCRSQRSRILTSPPVPYQVDNILAAIDALKPSYETQKNCNQEISKYIRGFGVFECQGAGDWDRVELPPGVEASPPEGQEVDASESVSPFTVEHLDAGSSFPIVRPRRASLGPLNNDLFTGGLDTTSIHDPFKASLDRLSLDIGEEGFDLDQPSPRFNSFDSPNYTETQDDNSVNWVSNSFCSIPRALSPEYLPRDERFLMYYYINKVVHLFPVLDNRKSPWKTVHVPRVLQSTGELALRGSTSQIRAALRNSILSISAFYMSKHVRVHVGIDESAKWSRDAMQFHGKSMKLLKDAVHSASASCDRPKYKELLATMLSMISINVLSEDTTSCGLHLDAAERLIIDTGKSKSRYSTKAKGLHRVYFYLRTIYESTVNRDYTNLAAAPMPTSAVSPLRIESTSIVRGQSSGLCQLTRFHETEQDLYQTIYAIPQILLILLNETTQLINDVNAGRHVSDSTDIPPHLAKKCEDLELRIMDWQSDAACSEDPNTPAVNLEIIRHMTQAFHQAIIIYFAQHIRLLNHRYLKPFVQNVLSNIEDVEKIKIDRRIVGSPLYWPAFIAASEAFDPDLQSRFNSWYEKVECYAIGSMDSGIRLLKLVWAEGPLNTSQEACLWRQVAARANSSLMLT